MAQRICAYCGKPVSSFAEKIFWRGGTHYCSSVCFIKGESKTLIGIGVVNIIIPIYIMSITPDFDWVVILLNFGVLITLLGLLGLYFRSTSPPKNP